jgi:hypothetical protein
MIRDKKPVFIKIAKAKSLRIPFVSLGNRRCVTSGGLSFVIAACFSGNPRIAKGPSTGTFGMTN